MPFFCMLPVRELITRLLLGRNLYSFVSLALRRHDTALPTGCHTFRVLLIMIMLFHYKYRGLFNCW